MNRQPTVALVLELSPKKWGSMEEQAAFLSAALRDRGWRSVLFFDAPPKGLVLAKLKDSGAELEELPHGGPLTFYPALMAALRKLRPSIVHFRLGNAFSALPVVAALSGARAVFLTEEYCRQRKVAPRTRVKCYLWDRVVLRALGTRVIAVSDNVRQVLVRDYKMRPERIRVLLHGVNTRRFAPRTVPANAEVRRELDIPDGDHVVVCAAHLVPEKGVGDLLIAAKQIVQLRTDVTIVIAGDGRASGELRQAADTLGIRSKVHFVGLRSDVDRLFAMADVAVVPSVCEEAAGLVLLEAMACGRPVVATRVGGIPEYVEDGKTAILVDRSSPDQLARALLSLLDSPSLATATGCAGRAAAEARFSMEGWVSETLAMYDEALNEG